MGKPSVKTVIGTIMIGILIAACGAGSSTPVPPTSTPPATAQVSVGSCAKVVTTALATVKDRCNAIGASQVCYGNANLDVSAASNVNFKAPGDIINLRDVKSIRTQGYDEKAGTWGIAVLRAAVNLPGTTAGQLVTFLMYGDTALDSVDAAMTTIAFSTTIGKQACEELPPSGMVVQVPRGQRIKFTANGADISLGSTAVLQAVRDQQFVVSVLEGQGEVTAQGVTQIVPAGFQTDMPLRGTAAAAPPTPPKPIPLQAVSAAPTNILPQPITQAQIQQVISAATAQANVTPTITSTPAQISQVGTPTRVSPATAAASVTPLLTWTPGPTLPPVSGGQNRIAFASNRDGNYEIYVMNADGSSAARLTNTPNDDRSPAWSPDGRQIAYVAFTGNNAQIFVVNADASNPRAITPDTDSAGRPAWSPDGQLIAYDRLVNNNRDIWVMKPDGTDAKALTTDPADDSQPAWSPDGKQIVFVSMRDGNKELYVMNADGSGQTRLTSNPAEDSQPAWSPDGKRLAFVSLRSGNGDIYTMNPDGSDVKRIVSNPARESWPTWSGDSVQLAFVSDREGTPAIYVINADGTGDPRRLTELSADNVDPAWQR